MIRALQYVIISKEEEIVSGCPILFGQPPSYATHTNIHIMFVTAEGALLRVISALMMAEALAPLKP
jgi:hypothetical protein